MEKTITPSQIGKLQELFGAALRKSNPLSEEAQDLIEKEWDDLKGGVTDAMTEAINRVLDDKRDTIDRIVMVNRGLTPQEVLDATSRIQYADKKVVASMPGRGEGEEKITVKFFKLGCYIGVDDLAMEYERRGLRPATPYEIAAVNTADPFFADKHPNGAQWDNKDGQASYVAFYRDLDERYVDVSRDDDWLGGWWFAGVRK